MMLIVYGCTGVLWAMTPSIFVTLKILRNFAIKIKKKAVLDCTDLFVFDKITKHGEAHERCH